MINTIIFSIAALIMVASFFNYLYLHKIKRSLTSILDNLACDCANHDIVTDALTENAKSLQYSQHLMEMVVNMDKYILSMTRVQLCALREQAVKSDDFEGAQAITKAISDVDYLLQQK